jgi:hypothetical protein
VAATTLGSAWFLIAILGMPALSFAVTSGQVDDFEDGTVMGWEEGFVSPNPPTNVPSGGPMGAGDNYLRNQSNGEPGPGGKMVMFNTTRWNGNYTAAGIQSLQMQLANPGPDTLFIRLAFEGSNTRYGSTTPFAVPPDNQWRTATFGLLAPDLTLLSGAASRETVLSGVVVLRILSARTSPRWDGDQVAAVLGVDNIIAVPQSAVGDPGASPPRPLTSAPNPFARTTTITYEVPIAAPIDIDILDVGGRAIRQLVSGETQPAGSHHVVWDGRDSRGGRVPPGVYLARLKGPGYAEIRKLVVAPY